MNAWILQDVRDAISIIEKHMWNRRHEITIDDGIHESLMIAISTLREREGLLAKVEEMKGSQSNGS